MKNKEGKGRRIEEEWKGDWKEEKSRKGKTNEGKNKVE